MNEVSVYALVSSLDTDKVRYIGVSTNPSKRLKQHVYDRKTESVRKSNPHKAAWIDSVYAAGGSIQLRILESAGSPEEAFLREMELIAEYRDKGHALTNIAVGGLGGVVLPPEEYAKASVNRLKAIEEYWTEDRRDALGAKISALWEDPEWREAQTEGRKALWQSEAYREAHAAGLTKARTEKDYLTKAAEGRKNSPIWKERVVSANKKKYENPDEVERARRDAQRGWDALSPEQRKDRGFKALRTRYYNFSKKNGWVLPLADITARIG